MALPPDTLLPATPKATAAEAQSRRETLLPGGVPTEPEECPECGRDFDIGAGVCRAADTQAYERDAPDGRDHEAHEPTVYSPDLSAHKLEMVLVRAVFEAFITVFRRKTERYVRLATGGSEVPAAGALPVDLQELLAKEVSKIASQFLNICICAIDYCPPVDLELGEFLRAVITADSDLVPDDPWDYRGAWIDAFIIDRNPPSPPAARRSSTPDSLSPAGAP